MATRGNAIALPPIRSSFVVPLSQPRAFELFVRKLPEWWPLTQRSVHRERAVSCHVEAEPGGRLFERASDGSEVLWGNFSLLEEPSRVVFSWHPGTSEKLATEIEVCFVAERAAPPRSRTEEPRASTKVVLEQRGWERLGERSGFVRGLFEKSWGAVLGRFVSASQLTLEQRVELR